MTDRSLDEAMGLSADEITQLRARVERLALPDRSGRAFTRRALHDPDVLPRREQDVLDAVVRPNANPTSAGLNSDLDVAGQLVDVVIVRDPELLVPVVQHVAHAGERAS